MLHYEVQVNGKPVSALTQAGMWSATNKTSAEAADSTSPEKDTFTTDVTQLLMIYEEYAKSVDLRIVTNYRNLYYSQDSAQAILNSIRFYELQDPIMKKMKSELLSHDGMYVLLCNFQEGIPLTAAHAGAFEQVVSNVLQTKLEVNTSQGVGVANSSPVQMSQALYAFISTHLDKLRQMIADAKLESSDVSAPITGPKS